ncbi:phage terminase small subunit [Bacillus cereus]|uniref:phage terminase small subunit n=1 Tax=Bacillus cereus TaxID=1396 RepID=UPI00203FAB28|nr:phage terminase small subunit [Bacillus cereus]MCM3223344.1 phage terminase small subunit [Bacillus cereus]
MARARSPNRDKAFEIFKENNGDITNRKIAEILEEKEKTISSWKSRYKWVAKLNGSDCSTAMKNDCSTTKKKCSTAKGGAPKGNKNAKGNSGNQNPKYGNKNAVGHGAPPRNSNAVTHGLFRKYLPAEVYELKAELSQAFQNDPLAMLWESIELHYANIIYSQSVMFVKDNEDMTKELRKTKESFSKNGSSSEEEYEIQFAWDKQANFLNAQSRAFAEFRSLIKQFDELAHVNDKRRLELDKMRAETQFVEERIKLIKGTKKDTSLMNALIDVVSGGDGSGR